MGESNRSNEFLEKTYSHLKDKVLPDALKNRQDYPPEEAWTNIIYEIENSIENIRQELGKRK